MTTTKPSFAGGVVRLGMALIAAAAVLLTLLPSAANAQTKTVYDRDGKGYAGEVRTTHAPRKLLVRVFAEPGGKVGRWNDLYIDTVKRNPGPEFLVIYSTDNERATLFRIGKFQTKYPTAKPRRCAGLSTVQIRQGLRYTVPRKCLTVNGKKPATLRTSLYQADETEKIVDWVPGVRQFGPWVRSSR